MRVLIIDDSPFLRQMLVRFFEKVMNWTVCAEAGDGREALQAFKTHNPDIVTLDVNMPRTSGVDALKGILECSPNAKVVLIMAVRGHQVRECLESGAKAVIYKPVQLQEPMEQQKIKALLLKVANPDASSDADLPWLRKTADQLCDRFGIADITEFHSEMKPEYRPKHRVTASAWIRDPDEGFVLSIDLDFWQGCAQALGWKPKHGLQELGACLIEALSSEHSGHSTSPVLGSILDEERTCTYPAWNTTVYRLGTHAEIAHFKRL